MEGFPTDTLSSSVDASIPGPIDPTSDPLRFFGLDGVSFISDCEWGIGGGLCVLFGVSDRETEASVCGLPLDMG
jgi:hypothetical protein